MPKQSPYPKFDLEHCLRLCNAIKNHQSIVIEKAAIILKLQVGGHFMNLVSSAAKFGLIQHKKGSIACTNLGLDCIDKKTEALTQAATQPKGFDFLFKQFGIDHKLDTELIAAHLKINQAVALKAQNIIEKSFQYALQNTHTKTTQQNNTASQQNKTELPRKDSSNYTFKLISDTLQISQEIKDLKDLNFCIDTLNVLKTYFTQND